jgi:uncharacterized protein (DUF885 family)
MSDFQRLIDEIVDHLLAENPVWATYVGVHDYDEQLPSWAAADIAARLCRQKEYATELQQWSSRELPPQEELDCKVAAGLLANEIVNNEQFRRWQRDPDLPLQIAMFAAMMLTNRNFAPLEERLGLLASRLWQVPRLLQEATENLRGAEEVPTVWAEMAEEGCRNAAHYFGEELPLLAADLPELKTELDSAGAEAATACDNYLAFLQEELTTRTRGSYALGREGFERLLREHYAITESAEELATFGGDSVTSISARMDELAAQISPGKSWQEVVAQLKSERAATEDVLSIYQREIKRSRDFVAEKNLVSLPPAESLGVQHTPEFKRSTLPFAAYMPPGSFEAEQRGMFWVTPIDGSAPPEIQEQQRRGHNLDSIILIALHEGFPGHHVQLMRASQTPSRICRLIDSSLFAEGWALYCEQLMGEQGYYDDPGTQLMQLVHELWRACRVVIDVGLHTGEMSFTEAVTILVEVAGADPVNAIAEVKRYTQSPTQPLSYLVGKRELLALKEDYVKKQGEAFDLRQFHDRLLSFGTVPFAWLRGVMLEQNGDSNR